LATVATSTLEIQIEAAFRSLSPPPPGCERGVAGVRYSLNFVPSNTAVCARDRLTSWCLADLRPGARQDVLDFTLSIPFMSVGADGLLPTVAKLHDDKKQRAQHARNGAQHCDIYHTGPLSGIPDERHSSTPRYRHQACRPRNSGRLLIQPRLSGKERIANALQRPMIRE